MMRLTHYLTNDGIRLGLVQGGRVFDILDLQKELGFSFPTQLNRITLEEVLAADLLGPLKENESKVYRLQSGLPIASAKLLSPILNPEKILLVARNYVAHVNELGVKQPSEPYLFTKLKNALIGPGEPILIPRVSKAVDWEVELAVIIGKAGKYISRNDAMNYVAGYTVSNDVSFRDLQRSTDSADNPKPVGANWLKGKGLDSSFPLGPWLVTKDEISDPHNLEISLSVNGEVKQHSSTSGMIFKIETLIQFASSGITLKPGDIISTGTPAGVAAATGGPFLKDGDIVECRINEIGSLRNPVKSEK